MSLMKQELEKGTGLVPVRRSNGQPQGLSLQKQLSDKVRLTQHYITIGLLSGVLLLAGCGRATEDSFAGSGTIEAVEITVSAETQGKIVRISIQEGDYVEKGRIIAEIDTEQIRLQREVAAADIEELSWNEKIIEHNIAIANEQMNQASITLDNVKKNHERIANLFNQKVATKEQLDEAETELALSLSRLQSAEKSTEEIKTRIGSLQAQRNKIKANLDLLDRRISDGTILNPIDAVVIERYVEQGEMVNFGTPICLLADLSEVWLKIYVSEAMLGKIKLGGKAEVAIDSFPDRKFSGEITWISQKEEFTPKNIQTKESRVDLVYAVKITLENQEGAFKIGMPADVYIEGL